MSRVPTNIINTILTAHGSSEAATQKEHLQSRKEGLQSSEEFELSRRDILTLLVPGPRPWDDEPDHEEFTYKEVRCEIKRHTTLFHLCGYLHIWEDQLKTPLTEASVQEMPLYGGVTFYDVRNKRRGRQNMNRYTIGFDCAHPPDLSPGILIAKAFLRGDTTMEKAAGFAEHVDLRTYKTMDFVEAELKDAVDWLVSLKMVVQYGYDPDARPKT